MAVNRNIISNDSQVVPTLSTLGIIHCPAVYKLPIKWTSHENFTQKPDLYDPITFQLFDSATKRFGFGEN